MKIAEFLVSMLKKMATGVGEKSRVIYSIIVKICRMVSALKFMHGMEDKSLIYIVSRVSSTLFPSFIGLRFKLC